MRNILFIILFFISIANKSFSQDKIYGGFKLAPNYSVFIDKAKDYSSGIGYSFGYFEVLELDYKINLQAEVNYTNTSFVYKVTNGSSSYKKTSNFNNIEVPIMVKFRPSENISLGLGYQFSFKSNGNTKTVISENNVTDEDKTTTKGINSSGLFFDANIKTGKTIVGLRVLKTNKIFIEPYNSLNTSIYVGFALF